MRATIPGALPAGWTRDPLPDSISAVRLGPPCPTCGSQGPSSGGMPPMTRTIDPSEADDGLYVVQFHDPDCPVFTGVAPELPCPTCGAGVTGYDFTPGVVVAVPDARFGTAHLVGTSDEVFANPAAQVFAAVPRPMPSLDQLTVSPCGHVLEGGAAHALLTLAARLRAEREQAAKQARIAAARPVLTAAAGRYEQLVNAYLHAVLSGSDLEAGLLHALRILVGDAAENSD